LTAFCFAGFGTDRLRREEVMKTAGRGNPNRWDNASSNRAHGAEVQNRILLIQVGCEARKIPAMGDIFFLTFPLSRNSPLVELSCGSSDDLESQFGGFRLEVFDL
jgi:hypothetical protein